MRIREPMLIREAAFVVVDTETTGTRTESDRLIEVAAVRVQSGVVTDRFSQLINPERTVPGRITQLTGITTAMVFEQPTAARVLPRLKAFLGDAVLVAHNLTFDLRFLNAELERAGMEPLANPTLCSLRLARRLLPGLPSKGLSSLIDFYGVRISRRHRALGDAEATAEIFLRFLAQLEDEHEIETVEDLLSFQHRRYYQAGREPAHLRRIRDEVLPQLPDRPGVYLFKNGRGSLLYVGKAKRLRARVRSYFSGIEGHGAHTRKLVRAVRRVEWIETGSELGALLLESRLIKEQQPRFNRAQLRYRHRPFIRFDTTHEAPRIDVKPYLQDDGAEYYGPLAGRRQAQFVVDVVNHMFKLRECDDDTFRRGRQCLYAGIGRCMAPCEGGERLKAYADEVQRVRDFLAGRDHTVLDALEDEMRAAAARMEYEQARDYRDWLRRLQQLLSKQRQVAAPVLDHNAVLVQPGVESGTVQLFLVRFGRLAATLTVCSPPSDEDVARLGAAVARHFDPDMERPRCYLKPEVEEVRLLAHWLYVYRDRARSVPWSPDDHPSAFMEAVLEAVATASEGPYDEEDGTGNPAEDGC